LRDVYSSAEEAISIRYMLRSLGVPLLEPTKVFGDNLGVIQNASCQDAVLQKKHVAIAVHRVWECVSHIFTKPVDGTSFKYHAWDMLWKSPTTR